MSHLGTLAAITGAALIAMVGQCYGKQLETMDDVGAALEACWTPPAGTGNGSVTLSFSFKRDGSLIGPPRPTAIDVEGDEQARKAFVDAAIAAVQGCVPLEIAPALAGTIAGTVYTMEFRSPKE